MRCPSEVFAVIDTERVLARFPVRRANQEESA